MPKYPGGVGYRTHPESRFLVCVPPRPAKSFIASGSYIVQDLSEKGKPLMSLSAGHHKLKYVAEFASKGTG